MGSSASKAARTAAGAAPRKYPTRTPPSSFAKDTKHSIPPLESSSQAPIAGPTVHPEPQASETKTEAVNLDASDPVYASQLRSLGAVQPNPILSHSSTNPADPTTSSSPLSSPQASHRRPKEPIDAVNQPFPVPQFPDPRNNPSFTILDARQRFQEAADKEFNTRGGAREFIDMGVIRQILILRDQRNMSPEDIEKRLELKKGVVGRLGPKGMLESI